MAAQQLSVKTMHDGFETSMIEVRNEDWSGFIEALAELQ